MSNRYNFNISLQQSLQLKGIALILLLCHHLFTGSNESQYNDICIFGYGLVEQLGGFSKVCVAIFVLLSGYGLTAKYQFGNFCLIDFYKHRFGKLYKTYWLIWLLFVPLGIFWFGRTFEMVYGGNMLIKFLINFLGFQDMCGFYGYNPTWWFMTLIFELYMLFPFLLKNLAKKDKIVTIILLLCLFIWFMPFKPVVIRSLSYYLICFVVGIMLKLSDYQSTFTPPMAQIFNTSIR